MKRLLEFSLIYGICLFSFGCAHTAVVAIEQGKMEVCGNQWSDGKDLVDQATASGCVNPIMLKAAIVGTGNYEVTHSGWGGGSVTQTTMKCMVFKCN